LRRGKPGTDRRKEPAEMVDEWIDRALRELGEHFLDRDVPERLRRLVRERDEADLQGSQCKHDKKES